MDANPFDRSSDAQGAGILVRRRVLCVQPNADLQPALQIALNKYRLTMVPNALEALREMHVRAFDAYVLDYWLPDWSGSSFCREVRKTDRDVPVVFFTLAEGEEQRKRAYRAGADAFLHVSQGAEAVAEKLRTLLRHCDARSLAARAEEERAVQEELSRRASIEIARSEVAKQRAAEAMERAARLKAQKAFLSAGGSLANFDRWWPQVFSSAAADHRVLASARSGRAPAAEPATKSSHTSN